MTSESRFVQVRLPDSLGAEQTMTFLAAEPGDTSNPQENGVVEFMAKSDPKKAAAAAKLLTFLKANEAVFFDWMAANPANSVAFATDPVAAVRKVFPDIDIDLN